MGVTVTGVRETIAMVEAAADRTRDLTPVLEVLAQDTRTLIDDAFAGSTTPENVPWAPLSPKTIARRRGGSATPLVDTGRLRNGIVTYGRGTTLSFGTNVGYGSVQQWGATRSGTLKRRSYSPRRDAGTAWTSTIPGRPFLPISRGGAGYQLMNTGMAGEHWRHVRESVRRYITTGRVS